MQCNSSLQSHVDSVSYYDSAFYKLYISLSHPLSLSHSPSLSLSLSFYLSLSLSLSYHILCATNTHVILAPGHARVWVCPSRPAADGTLDVGARTTAAAAANVNI
jgi:hypothetical protein